ncbi:BppU family phage baseplate upper protein [Enterococcus sp. AZ196]|uniref:BppU family phage baseplate upper protein n=1 Tax=Enterococcus sp. AZ196 TaxID=2774659 RepID=UPI003D2BA421
MIYEEIWLDINKFETGYAVAARQNEEIAQLKLIITNNGVRIDNTQFTVRFIGNNPKGDLTDGSANRTNESGSYLYTFTKENLSVPGKYQNAYFQIFDRYGKEITSCNFEMRVIDQADMSADQATVHVSILDEMLNKHDKELTEQKEEFIDYSNQQKDEWGNFVDSNKEIIQDVDPGGKVLTELIEARKPQEESAYPTLKERLDANDSGVKEIQSRIDGSNDPAFLALNGGLEDRLIQFYETNVSKINQNAFKINLITDMHYQKSIYLGGIADHGLASQLSIKYLQMHGLFSKHCDLAILNGDNVHGRENKELTRKANEDVRKIGDMFECPTVYQIGNHDDAVCYKPVKDRSVFLSLQELKDVYKVSSFNRKLVSEKHKLMILAVSTYDNPERFYNNVNQYPRDLYSIITTETFNFVKTSLQECPDDYRVLIVQHCPLNGTNGMSSDLTYNINHGVMLTLLQAFNNSTGAILSGNNSNFPVSGTVDFKNKPKNRLLAVVSGHKHKDEFSETGTIRHVTRISQVCSAPDGTVTREIGTDTEVAVDIIEVTDTKLKFNRLGVGESLEFSI